jgi:hypothetical protein
MITSFDDFCTWLYVIVDDIWHHIGHMFSHPGPTARSHCGLH